MFTLKRAWLDDGSMLVIETYPRGIQIHASRPSIFDPNILRGTHAHYSVSTTRRLFATSMTVGKIGNLVSSGSRLSDDVVFL